MVLLTLALGCTGPSETDSPVGGADADTDSDADADADADSDTDSDSDTDACTTGLELNDCPPDFTLPRADGSGDFTLADVAGNKRVVVIGTATW